MRQVTTEDIFLVQILIKHPDKSGSNRVCNTGSTVWCGEASYIRSVKWCDFIAGINSYINDSYVRQENIDSYKIHTDLNQTA